MTLDELLYGKEFATRKEGFKRALKIIEQAHSAYFAFQPSPFSAHMHNSLSHHYLLRVEGEQVVFGFVEGSDLDEAIQSECAAAFHQWFGSATGPVQPARAKKNH